MSTHKAHRATGDPTPAELASARLAAAGMSTLDIADELDIAPTTVQHHIGSIYLKLGVGCRIDLAAALARLDEVPRQVNGRRQDHYLAIRAERAAYVADLMAADWAARRDTWWPDFMAAGR